MSGIHIPVTADYKNFVDGMNAVRNSVRSTMDDVEKSGMSIEDTFNKIRNAAALSFAGFSGAKLIKDIANVRGEFQQLEVAFSTMLGSEEKATDLMNQLVKTAAITPFDLKGVADGAKSLMAYGTAAEDVNATLVRLGDIAAGMSIPLNDLVYLYGTTMVQGRMFTQDLRQFQGRGIPIAEELAKVLKTTKDQIPDLVTAGKVTSEVFNQAIVNMTSAGSKFGGLMEKQSKTIKGQISNIEDAIDTMFNDIGKNSEGIINGALGVVSKLVENYERVGKVLLGVVATYGTYKAAVMVVSALQTAQAAGLGVLTAAEATHYGWLVLVEKAQKLLNATMLSNPYVLAATALAGLVAVMANMKTQQDLVNEAEEEYSRRKEEAIAKEQEHKQRIEELIGVCNNEATSTDIRRDALYELEKKYPDIFAKYDTEAEKLQHILDIKKEIAALDGQSSVTSLTNEIESNYRRIQELEKKGAAQYKTTTTSYGAAYLTQVGGRTEKEEAELLMLKKKVKELNTKKSKASVDNYLKDLTGISNADLQRQITERENLLAKMDVDKSKKYGNVKFGGASGVFGRDELQFQLNKLRDESNRRNEKRYTTGELKAQAKKALDDAREELKKFDNADSKMTAAEAEIARQKLVDAVDDAEKKYKKYGGVVKNGGGKSDDTKKRNAANIEEERRYQEELSNIQQQAIDARTDATIAAIKNDAERQRAEEDEQHLRNLRQIEEQANEMRKAIYEHNKTVWENSHKDSPYELTEAGKAGWSNIQLSQEQKTVIDSNIKKENEEYSRLIRARYESEEQILRDFLKEYGTYQEKKYAIAKEYEKKISDAEAAGQRNLAAKLRADRDRELGGAKAQELAGGIDFSQVTYGLSKVMDGIMEETLRKIREYKFTEEYKSSKPESKQAIAQLEAQLLSQGVGGSKSPFGSWADIKKHSEEFDKAIKKTNEAYKRHEDAMEKLEEAEKQLAEAENKGVSEREKAILKANVKIAEQQFQATGENLQNAQQNQQGAGQQVKQDLEDVDKGLQNFSTILNQLTSGSLSGFADGVANLIQSISKGSDGAAKGLASLGKGGSIVSAILQIIDALGDDAAGFIDQLFDKITKVIENLLANIPELLTSIFEGIGNLITGIVSGLGSWFGFNDLFGVSGNSKEVAETTDRLTKQNERLSDKISELTETIEKSYGTRSIVAYDAALEAQKELQKNNMEILNAQMDEWGRHHSNTYYADDTIIKKYYEASRTAIEKGFGQLKNMEGQTVTINGLEDFYSLSPESLKAIKTYAPMLWNYITTVGEYDKSEYWENAVEQAGKVEELTKQIRESLTQTTEDNIFDDLMESLYNLADGAEDAFDDIEGYWQKMVNRMVLANVLGEELRKDVEEWYQALSETQDKYYGETSDSLKEQLEILQARLNEAQAANKEVEDKYGIFSSMLGGTEYNSNVEIIETLKKEIAKIQAQLAEGNMSDIEYQEEMKKKGEELKALYEKYGDKTQSLIDMGVIGPTGEHKNEDKSATYSAADKVTYDQMDEFTGILRAVQIAGEQRLDVQREILYTLQTMSGITSPDNADVKEIRNLIGISNDYLLDIKRSNLSILGTVEQGMNDIINKLNALG